MGIELGKKLYLVCVTVQEPGDSRVFPKALLLYYSLTAHDPIFHLVLRRTFRKKNTSFHVTVVLTKLFREIYLHHYGKE